MISMFIQRITEVLDGMARHPGGLSSDTESETGLSPYLWQVGGALPSQAFEDCIAGDSSVECCMPS